MNSSLTHTEAYSYDALNRLTQAVATGNSTYNFTFNYDRWGNMTCVINGNTNGPCPQYSFNSANNQINNSGYTYDAAGDLTQDPSTNPAQTYQWDAEGRLAEMLRGSTTYTVITYNALGSMVEQNFPPFGLTHEVELRDPSGGEFGAYDGSNNVWYDRDIRAAGRMVAQSFPGETYFLHANLLNSDTQITDYSGTMQNDWIYYPWRDWTRWGGPIDAHFDGFEVSEGPNFPTPFRQYSGDFGRWLSPDPLGGDITNPQSLNRYAYALNNPTTLTDPLGLDSCDYTGDFADCTINFSSGSSSGSVGFGFGSQSGSGWQGPFLVAFGGGSLPGWSHLTVTPVFPRLPNGGPTMPSSDVPLNPFATQVFAQVYSSLSFLDPQVCGGGGFGFIGPQMDIPSIHVHFSLLGVGGFDSNQGLVGGGLFEVGAGPFSYGREKIYGSASGQWESGNLFFVGRSQVFGTSWGAFGAGALLGSRQVGAYGEIGPQINLGRLGEGAASGGAGGYLNLGFGGCH